MGLILGMAEGDDFYMDDTQAVVTKIHSPKKFELTVIDERGDPEVFLITDREATTVKWTTRWSSGKRSMDRVPLIRISCGARGKIDIARVAIDAPRIVTGKLRDHLVRQ